MGIQLFAEDGLEVMKRGRWDHVITDPDYEKQPHVGLYRANCDGNVLVFCDPTKRPAGSNPDEVLFWLKPQSTKWSTKRCNKFVEEILVYKGKKSVFNVLHWSSMTGMFNDGFLTKPEHPYGKPPTLIEKLLLMYTSPGDTVFDPFMGSGTVGVACAKHGRNYVGCETDPKFFEVAKRLTGA